MTAAPVTIRGMVERVVEAELSEVTAIARLSDAEVAARRRLLDTRGVTPRDIENYYFAELVRACSERYPTKLGADSGRMGGYGWTTERIIESLRAKLEEKVGNMIGLLRRGKDALGVIEDWDVAVEHTAMFALEYNELVAPLLRPGGCDAEFEAEMARRAAEEGVGQDAESGATAAADDEVEMEASRAMEAYEREVQHVAVAADADFSQLDADMAAGAARAAAS
jgi:hypothetical protein